MTKFILFLIFILVIRIGLYIYFPPPVAFQKDVIREATVFTGIKDHIKTTYSKYLSYDNSALLMGIVFGEKDLAKSDIKMFQATGVMHIIAASGMNVSMFVEFLLVTLLIFMRRQYALVIAAVAVIFYSALCGFQASIVRAAIMAILALGAGVSGRQNTSLLALFFAAWAMILWDPSIITSISFMLSFSATLGIILFDPIFKKTFLKNDLFEDFKTSISAQIATTPIILFFFGVFSFISIIVNLLVLWTIPPLMILGMLAALLSFVSDLLAAPFVYLSLPLISYFWVVVGYFSQITSPIEIKNIPWTIVVGYYLILIAFIIYIQKNLKPKKAK